MSTANVGGVEALAQAQLGVLSRVQCLGLGMASDSIRWMLRSGRWLRVHPGVYATHTGPLTWRAVVSAALLYCGEGAVASHGTAARLHGLVDHDPEEVQVLIPATRRVARPSRVQVSTCAEVASRTAPSGWPSRTTVEDTVLDLAAGGDADNAIAWLSKSCQRRRTTTARLAEALGRRTRHRWRELLVDALSDEGAGVFRDRVRDNITAASGKVSLRFGWADVDAQACEVAQDVALLLWSRGWRGKLRRCGVGCRVSA